MATVQDLIEPWWEKTEKKALEVGRLVWTFVPAPDVLSNALIMTSRDQDATDHSRAVYTVEPMRTSSRRKLSALPVAAVPTSPGESYIAQRGKIRPAVLLTMGGDEVPRSLLGGAPGYQRKSCVLVAPYYGADRDGTRAGYPREFIDRVRQVTYPQYMLDRLPLTGSDQSLLRLDHVLAMGRDPQNFNVTEHKLSDDAIEIVRDWFRWLVEGQIPVASPLQGARDIIRENDAIT